MSDLSQVEKKVETVFGEIADFFSKNATPASQGTAEAAGNQLVAAGQAAEKALPAVAETLADALVEKIPGGILFVPAVNAVIEALASKAGLSVSTSTTTNGTAD